MKDESWDAFDGGARMEGGIHTAVELWCMDPAAAKQQYGPIASWNTSEITNMGLLFIERNFNDDISRWDVSSVTDMGGMFHSATSFNGDISQWHVSQVTNMTQMLYRATSFNCDLSQWDVSKVTSMSIMLYGATSFTHQLAGAWLTCTAHKYRMFRNCAGSIAGKTNNADGTPV